MATLRIMLVDRGERLKGTVVALVEVSLWLLVTGTVLVGFREDILWCVVFVLAFALREDSYAVTVLDGEGKDGQREILVLHLKRKRIPNAIAIIKTQLKSPMITLNDVRVVKGGFIKK